MLFAVFWTVAVVSDYINKNPFYEPSFTYFRYLNLSLYLIVIAGTVSLIFLYDQLKKYKSLISNGLGLFLLVTVEIAAITIAFASFTAIDFNVNHLINMLGINFQSILYLLLVTLSAYIYGDYLAKYVKQAIYKIAVGIIIICNLLFLFGVFHFINIYSVLAILIIPILPKIPSIPKILHSTFIARLEFEKISILGTFSLVLIVFFFMLNFIYSQIPFPTGFDSRNFYMNIARLISGNEGLVFGWRPYNWGLLVSTGFTVFGKNEVAVSLSLYGYILALFGMFHLGFKVLKMNINYVLFFMLIVTVTPAIANQQFVEHKTDLALLFFQTVSISLFIEIFGTYKANRLEGIANFSQLILKDIWPQLILLGLFLGFGLSIKLTNMFLVFSLLISVFAIKGDSYKFIGVIAIALAIFLIVRLDDLTGLRRYHLSVGMVILGCLILGTVLLGLSFFKSKQDLIKSLYFVIIIGICSGLPMIPWITKNYIETRSLNPNKLLNGAQTGPDWDIRQIDRDYQNYHRSRTNKKG